MSKHRRPGDRRPGLVLAALAVAGVTLLGATSPALAAKGGGAGKPTGGGGKNTTQTGSLSLRMLDPTDTTVNYADDITFDVQSSATYPMVEVTCYQGATLVFRQGVGFYPGYPFSQTFHLAGWAWPGGAATCKAELYAANSDGSYRSHLADLPFTVSD